MNHCPKCHGRLVTKNTLRVASTNTTKRIHQCAECKKQTTTFEFAPSELVYIANDVLKLNTKIKDILKQLP